MRNSTLKAVTASFAAVAMIVSLGTAPALARGGGGGHGGGGAFHGGEFGGGGFHAGGQMSGGYDGHGFYGHPRYRGYYNACVPNTYDQSGNPGYSPYSWPYTC